MKIKNTDETMTLRGVEFPKGKAVKVDDPSLLRKCLSLPNFVEVKGRKNDKNTD
ncbi:MAG: hypothetical protein ACPG4X_20385 [Pikeienuella sp.]